MKLFLRLTSEVNDGLRSLLRYRGDLSRFVEEALSRADLMRLELVSPLKRRTRGTTAVVNKEVVAGWVRQPNVEDARRPCSLQCYFTLAGLAAKPMRVDRAKY